MFNKFVKALNTLHKGQKGISGLETAIILIAFVTVASVLAYSVLSAGIFSAEEGQKAVYAGLEGAQSTMEVKGSVLGLSAGGAELETVQIVAGMAIAGFKNRLDASGRKQVLVCGIECHVCVYQTAMDLKEAGYEVQVVADAVSSRTAENREIGLNLMRQMGIAITGTETALFELLKIAEGEKFKAISSIVK